MKIFNLLYVILIFFSSSLVHAQHFVKEPLTDRIIYKSPKNGDTDVPTRTTLIVRPDQAIIKGRSAKDFSFKVIAESSGAHRGTVIFSDDSLTIIFKPDLPFNLNEKVNVTFAILGLETFAPLFYSFRITPMSDVRQNYWLNTLRDKEKKEMETFQNEVEIHNQHREIQGSPLDTLPSNFPVITIDFANSAKLAPGNIFIAPNGNFGSFIIILDSAGKPYFERELSTKLGAPLPFVTEDFKLGLDNTMSYFKLDSVLLGEKFFGSVYRLDSHYRIIDTFQCGNGYHIDWHDFKLLPKGHALVIAYDPKDSVDMRVITGDPNASSHATVLGAIIQELDSKKIVVYQWRSWDHFNITDATHLRLNNPNERSFDYAHLNSVDMDTDGKIIASFRHLDEVTKIDPLNDHIIWRWGGKHNYFTFIGDTLPFSYQHDVRRIANGNITVWDNGNYHKTVWGDGSYHDTAYSRAVEYELNESGPLTAKAVWQFSDVPFSSAGGNVQRLTNGNTFIGFGFPNNPNAIEVTPSGEKVFQLSLPGGTFNYRAFRFEFPPASSVVYSPVVVHDFGIQSIYPNPARNTAAITFFSPGSGIAQIELLNILGNTVWSSQVKISAGGTYISNLDLHSFPNGIYYCKVSQSGSVSMKVIVVQK